MIPEFIRFYSYTASQTLLEYAQTFFALVNQMYRLQAKESIQSIVNVSAAQSGGEHATRVLSDLQKQEKGISGIVEEVKNIKKAKNG